MSSLRRSGPLAAVATAILALYLYNLNGVGVVGPDEPRYAAIGRAMASSHDFITPVLWGKPWFEKPPLLYWMTALGAAIGLTPDLCGRLPVVLLSLLFLVATYVWTAREFGRTAGIVAVTTLATSAGWLTYSSFCLTDLPLAVTFCSAAFLACSLLRDPVPAHLRTRFALIGALIGLAILAKGLVPIALALPFVYFLRSWVRYWWLSISACLAVALPWYLLVYARNGFAFIDDFFIKHHLQRLYSATLLHTQPPYYYLPVLLVGLLPWTPLFGLLFNRRELWDQRRLFLLAVAIVGLVFFSLSRNKLPHYVLPILPVLFVLLASRFEHARLADVPRPWLLACALLLSVVPLVAGILPQVLAVGKLSRMALDPLTLAESLFIALPVAVVLLARRSWAPAALVLCTVAEMAYLKTVTYPVLDQTVSPRLFWIANAARLNHVCNVGTSRDWLYGLSYYRREELPDCRPGDPTHYQYALRTVRHGAPELIPLP